MSLDQDFCDSPYQFMKKHIVIVKLSDGFQKPRGNEVTAFVVKYPFDAQIENPPVPDSQVCFLHLTEDPGAPAPPRHTRKVYWCHYEYDSCHGTVLGRKHVYMFTPQMDGCTFGAGSQTSDGITRVAHCNAGEFGRQHLTGGNLVGSLQVQAHKQVETLDATFARKQVALGRIVSPFGYLKGDDGIDFRSKATTFGRRNEYDQWKFYTQTYRTAAGKFIHCGVKDYTRTLT